MRPIAAASAVVLLTLTLSARGQDPPWTARARGGLVASDSPEASRIGAAVLTSGGNAFDAAVATSFALAVSRPQSTGLGGGGFMVAYVAGERRFITLDFRETAPSGATGERFAKLHAARGDGPSPSVYGGNAVGTPGQIAGLAEIAKRFGTRPLADLAQPAIKLADAGFMVDESFRRACSAAIQICRMHPQLQTLPGNVYGSLLGGGTAPRVGSRLKRPGLARALREIAERGPRAFYEGPIGQAAVRAVQAAGGTLNLQDLRDYRVREREPIRFTYRGYEIISMPPPSSGGICLAEALNILDLATADWGRSARAPRAVSFAVPLVQAMKLAFADRARWLGDPDFSQIPTARLISRAYAREHLAGSASNKEPFGGSAPPDDGGTSHFCVADRFGNIVALTETVNGLFGSLVVAEPYGVILNNQMDDFTTVAGQANLYGLVQSEANRVAPGKRPLSSMSPTIVTKDGRAVLVAGASGGPRIISAVLQVALNVIEFDMPLAEAVSAVRLHHQWRPDEVYFDRAPPAELAALLKESGHKLSDKRRTGIVQAIQFLEDGTMVGASDPRKGGRPAGVP